MIIPLGSIVNALAVVFGSLIGLAFGQLLPQKIKEISFQIMGLFTLVLGFHMAQSSANFLLILVSLLTGTLIGELINIELLIEKLNDNIKRKLNSANENFSQGLLTAFLLYCVGSMTIVGAIEEGIQEKRTLLYTKSLMDGITSILLASNFGVGVLVSALPLLIFQSILTLGASYLEPLLSELLITEISALGGFLIIAIGLNILELKKIRVSNMLPALFIIVPIYYLVEFIA